MAMNVTKNWPLGGALEDSAKPKTGEDIIAGMAVKKDAAGELVKADGSSKEQAYFALDSQDAYDVIEADRIPYILGNAQVQTDQYLADAYAPGDELQVSATVTEEGLLKKHLGAGAPTYGWVDAVETVDGIVMLTINKPLPMGEAS
jgi:hypothetical protein